MIISAQSSPAFLPVQVFPRTAVTVQRMITDRQHQCPHLIDADEVNQQHVRIVAERFQHDLHAAVEQQEQRHRVAVGVLFPLGKQHDREQHDHRGCFVEEHRMIAASQVAEERQPCPCPCP